MSLNRRHLFIGLVLLLLLVYLTPAVNPLIVDLDNPLAPMTWQHPLGTDPMGRDMLGLLQIGLKRAGIAVIAGAFSSVVLGLILGVTAGLVGGWIKRLILLLAEILEVLPTYVIALIITAMTGLDPVIAGVVLGILSMGSYIEEVTRLTQKYKEESFIIELQKIGVDSRTILFKHLLPIVLTFVSTGLGSRMAGFVQDYTGLAFIGLGTDIALKDWGKMLSHYQLEIFDHSSLIIWPTLIIIVVTALFLLLFSKKEARGHE